jgi:hypothetical protein
METKNIELGMLEAVTIEAAENETRALNELQLAYVGGGNAIVTLG